MWDSKRDINVENRLLDSVEEGKGGMIWENSTETCILPYVKQIASPGLMHETGRSGLVHWDDPEGWDGEGGEKGFRLGNTCTPVADSCQCMAKPLQYCKVISLQLNNFYKRVFSRTSIRKHQFFSVQPSLWSNSSHPHMTTRKTIALTIQTFVGHFPLGS